MTNLGGITRAGDESVRAYEALRTAALAGTAVGDGGGLITLIRAGVAGWMVGRAACSSTTPRGEPTVTAQVGDEDRDPFVRVLASMAVAGLEQEGE